MRGQLNKEVLAQFLGMLQTGALPKTAVSRKKDSKKSKRKTAAPKDEAEIELAKIRNNELVKEAFTQAGYTDIQPRVNVLTYGKWEEQGRRVMKGQKAVRVGNFNLFHFLQTEPITADTPAAA